MGPNRKKTIISVTLPNFSKSLRMLIKTSLWYPFTISSMNFCQNLTYVYGFFIFGKNNSQLFIQQNKQQNQIKLWKRSINLNFAFFIAAPLMVFLLHINQILCFSRVDQAKIDHFSSKFDIFHRKNSKSSDFHKI